MSFISLISKQPWDLSLLVTLRDASTNATRMVTQFSNLFDLPSNSVLEPLTSFSCIDQHIFSWNKSSVSRTPNLWKIRKIAVNVLQKKMMTNQWNLKPWKSAPYS
jgi:hypothetical protein